MRRPHFLKPNHATESPRELFFFDTETHQVPVDHDTVEHHLWFGWVLHVRLLGETDPPVRKWFRFTTPLELAEWLESRARPKTRQYVFAHRLQFDARVCEIPQLWVGRGWKLRRLIVEDPPTLFVLRRDKVTFEFLDTRNWFAQALVKLGDRVGLPKLTMPDKSADAATWDTYCRRDVEVIERTMLRWRTFLREHDLGSFQRTLAGQAFTSYRHRFMPTRIFVHSNESSLELARSTYTAGRVECFHIGRVDEEVTCFDVNSMYPYVMAGEHFPSVHVSHRKRVDLDELRVWASENEVVARVVIETDEPVYPYRTDERLLFPIGRYEVALSGPELRHALERGRVVRCFEASIYESAPLFRTFVDYLYRCRQRAGAQGDEVERYLLKIMMNSLYGKFGQQGRRWETIGEVPDNDVHTWIEADYETGARQLMRRVCGNVQEFFNGNESYHSLPSIASYVTSYARLLLWKYILLAGRENVLYCDTDSLVVTRNGANALRTVSDAERLGALKEEWTSTYFVTHGPKDYETDSFRKCKGVRFGAEWLQSNVVSQEQWSSMKADIRVGLLRKPRTTKVLKELRRVYMKGKVGPTGRVSPFVLTWNEQVGTRQVD